MMWNLTPQYDQIYNNCTRQCRTWVHENNNSTPLLFFYLRNNVFVFLKNLCNNVIFSLKLFVGPALRRIHIHTSKIHHCRLTSSCLKGRIFNKCGVFRVLGYSDLSILIQTLSIITMFCYCYYTCTVDHLWSTTTTRLYLSNCMNYFLTQTQPLAKLSSPVYMNLT